MQLSLFGASVEPTPSPKRPTKPLTQQALQPAQQAQALTQQAPQPAQDEIPPRVSNLCDASPQPPEHPKSLRERIERYLIAARAVATWDKASRRASGVFLPSPQERDHPARFALWCEAQRTADEAWASAQKATHNAAGWKSHRSPPSLPGEAAALATQVLLDFEPHIPIKTTQGLAHLLHPLAPKPDGGGPREDLLDLREDAFRALAHAMHDQRLKSQGLDLLLERVVLALEGYDADELAVLGELRHRHLRQVQARNIQPPTEAQP